MWFITFFFSIEWGNITRWKNANNGDSPASSKWNQKLASSSGLWSGKQFWWWRNRRTWKCHFHLVAYQVFWRWVRSRRLVIIVPVVEEGSIAHEAVVQLCDIIFDLYTYFVVMMVVASSCSCCAHFLCMDETYTRHPINFAWSGGDATVVVRESLSLALTCRSYTFCFCTRIISERVLFFPLQLKVIHSHTIDFNNSLDERKSVLPIRRLKQ